MSEHRVPESYVDYLEADGLRGARIGVFRRYMDTETIDAEVRRVMVRAIGELRDLGAEIVDPVKLPDFESLTENLWCNTFHHDVDDYLKSLGEDAPYPDLESIVASGLYSDYIESRLRRALRTTVAPENQDPPCTDVFTRPANIAFRDAVLKMMEASGVDAIVYPTWSNPPRRIGDMDSPAGDNSQDLAPHTGFPAITVPIGFTYDSLPAGMTFIGPLFSEPDLIRMAYAYEQGTRHRRPPEKFPELKTPSYEGRR